MLTSSEMLRYVEVSDERGASICGDKHSVEMLDPEEGGSYSVLSKRPPGVPEDSNVRQHRSDELKSFSSMLSIVKFTYFVEEKLFIIRFKALYTNDKDLDHT